MPQATFPLIHNLPLDLRLRRCSHVLRSSRSLRKTVLGSGLAGKSGPFAQTLITSSFSSRKKTFIRRSCSCGDESYAGVVRSNVVREYCRSEVLGSRLA